YLPYPLLSGGQIRTYNLLKKLSKKHKITLFALIKDHQEKEHIPELLKYCSEIQVFKRSGTPFTFKNIIQTALSTYPFLVIRNHVPEVITAVKKALASNEYDLIHAETFYMMPHLPKTTIPTLLVEQTIEYVGYESYAKKAPFFLKPFLAIDIAKIKHWETYYWNTADSLIVMSDEDKTYIQNYVSNPKKVEVVANGVDTMWFNEKSQKNVNKPTVLFVGTFKWLPNVEAVTFLAEKIWPAIRERIKDAQLWIVGNAPTAKVLSYQNIPGIKVTGTIPDIRDAFSGSDLLIAPVLSGKGTRYKVLEAMASGTPIVATHTAVEGLDVTNSVHAMIADEPQQLAEQVVTLLENNQLRKKLADNGRAFVKKRYDWSLIADELDSIYKKFRLTRT
ncbi:MAG: glycosyltransferase family 4 protein, partial [Microgenomates group bacterium]